MKASELVTNRFGMPSVLSGEITVLGATAAEWQEQFTCGFRTTFDELKIREEAYKNSLSLLKP